ncbi:hypothetical protein [Oceanisphaera pacifica]|uniref:YtkA-like domain-containing protein n=1 Tax=Oceanisphaera pacifica TaxID=2818389 RepID=A0ABS3NFU6_9GAMM|nr:hypothetical protein [Oceanisphaera pacifica]MBO1519461.1 hypothetical protein [Oceanisphaera pacifica]
MKDKLTTAKLGQIIFVLVILVAAFWFRTAKNDKSGAELASSNAVYCDIGHNKCVTQQGELRATAQLTADKLQPESPFQLNITLSDSNATVLNSRLEGHSMYMGTLPALIKQQAPGVWKGQALVGACTESSMVWAWVLDIEHQGETQPFKFLFEVKR